MNLHFIGQLVLLCLQLGVVMVIVGAVGMGATMGFVGLLGSNQPKVDGKQLVRTLKKEAWQAVGDGVETDLGGERVRVQPDCLQVLNAPKEISLTKREFSPIAGVTGDQDFERLVVATGPSHILLASLPGPVREPLADLIYKGASFENGVFRFELRHLESGQSTFTLLAQMVDIVRKMRCSSEEVPVRLKQGMTDANVGYASKCLMALLDNYPEWQNEDDAMETVGNAWLILRRLFRGTHPLFARKDLEVALRPYLKRRLLEAPEETSDALFFLLHHSPWIASFLRTWPGLQSRLTQELEHSRLDISILPLLVDPDPHWDRVLRSRLERNNVPLQDAVASVLAKVGTVASVEILMEIRQNRVFGRGPITAAIQAIQGRAQDVGKGRVTVVEVDGALSMEESGRLTVAEKGGPGKGVSES